MTSTAPIFTGTLSTSIETAPPTFFVGENDRLQASQLRIVTIVMTAFNIVCVASMIFRILWDARRAYMKRRRRSRRKAGAGGLGKKAGEWGGGRGKSGGAVTVKEVRDGGEKGGEEYAKEEGWEEVMGGGRGLIPAIEIFPLVLGGTMLVQGILLAFVEGVGLDGRPITRNCRYLSEVAWVAQWITPYMVFSFILEACIRAVSQPRFKRRSGTAVVGCIVLALFLLLATWVPSRIVPERAESDICSGQLMSYTDQFAVGGLGIMVVLLPVSVLMGTIVLVNLRKDCGVDKVEKISTSRTVYFLMINVPQWIMMIPNYAVTANSGPQHGLVYLATFIINLSGAAATVLHLYLRAKAQSLAQPPYSTLSRSSRTRPNTSRRPPPPYEKPPPPYQKPRSTPRHHNRKPDSAQPNRANRLSSYTTRGLHRLGGGMTTIFSSAKPSPSITTFPSPPHNSTTPSSRLATRNSPAYTLFPPIPTRYRPPTDQLPTSTPPSSRTTPPHRPSRAVAPTINMSRSQASPRVPERAHLAKQERRFLAPAAAIEVAIPPGGRARDMEDAESFREILLWKEEGEVSAQEGVVGRFV
ncbi:hypothetical protein HOY82DRAFT_671857 [Tuber indicum]|nr:hypothetical protein HOY82DRAFT_671857 [Tuber indicum]